MERRRRLDRQRPAQADGQPHASALARGSGRRTQILKELVDTSFAGFKELVLSNRKKLRENAAAQESVFTGRIFTAKQAQDAGLVDELCFIEDAIDRAVRWPA